MTSILSRALTCGLLAGLAATVATTTLRANGVTSRLWPCRPDPVALPEGFDPEEIYFASRPSVLPDGKHFIFEWCDAIWLAPIEGGTAKVLQHSTGRDAWPIVSRDGKRFAFQSNRAGGWHVFVADLAEGAVARQVGFNSEGERPYAWSADNSELLCYVLRDDEGSAFDMGRLAWLPVDKRTSERRVFDAMASEPAISPDGRYILFIQEGEDLYRKGTTGENVARIWCYDTHSDSFTLAVKHTTESLTPIWAPDGKGFYYVSGQGGTRNIWWHDFPGTTERQLTHFKGDSVIHPSLSADGTTMVFRQGFYFWSFNPATPEIAPRKITLVPEDTGLVRLGTRRRSFDSLWNNDSPGSLTATSGGLEFGFTVGGDLYVMDTILREPRLVYGDTRTHERDCAFSRDGQRLYFFSDRGDSVALLAAERARPDRFWWENSTFAVRPLIEDNLRREALSVSPDGTRLAWIETGSVLAVSDLEGKIVRRFSKVKSVGGYDWSPDGRWLVAMLSDDYGNNDVWILSIDDPAIAPYNLSRSFTWDAAPSWSPDGRLIMWNGQRAGSGTNLFYVWLRRADEGAQTAQAFRRAIEHMGANIAERPIASEILGTTIQPGADPNSPDVDVRNEVAPNLVQIDFEDLHSRVQAVPIAELGAPFFAPDSRRILFPATIDGRAGTYEVTVPDRMTPRFLKPRWGQPVGWFGKDPDPARADRLVLITPERKIGTLDETYEFRVYQELDVRDYQELGFLLAWGILRDNYYDPNFHGADWEAIRHKYQAAARYAPTRSIFTRIIHSLNGELNSSHLGFYDNDYSRKLWNAEASRHTWEPVTSHLGIVFDQDYTGAEGWMVKRIVPGGPADVKQVSLKPGDLVLAVEGHPVRTGMDPTLLLNGPQPGKFTLDVRSGDTLRKVYIEATTYSDIRNLTQKAMYKARRDYVHQRSGGAFGYINIAKMDNDEYYRFEREIFAEGFDKAGMVVDVRDNIGGFTADKVLNILGVQRHSWSVARNGNPAYLASYWGRPVFDKPIVVLCNQNTVSNGEIFSHAIKQLGRGKLVGIQTNGGVIATSDGPLLDLGMIRRAHYGWYTLDGTDMELHGAIPDVIVEITPADSAAGRDPQLDAAIDVLHSEVKRYQQEVHPFEPKTFSWDHQL